MKNKILIIGGCGYIGSTLFLYLKDKNYDVKSVDLEWFNNPNIPNLKEDFNNLGTEFISKFDCIILLAGNSSVKMSENMVYTFNNNVRNFINLLPKLNKNQKFIYASSSSLYSNLSSEPKEESCKEYSATNYYDFSKYAIDSYMKIYGEQNPIEYYGLRFGTLSGFSPNLRTDIMINSMWNNAMEGKGININNIGIHRPILVMNDLCRAIESIIEKGNFDKRGFYNLASFNSTVLNIGQEVTKILNCKLNISSSNTKCYDFQISSKKFINNFGFIFEGSIESIVNSLIENQNKILFKSHRNNNIIYV